MAETLSNASENAPVKRKPSKKKSVARKKATSKGAAAKTAKRPARRAASEPTQRRAMKLALNLVEFEKTTFGNATRLLGTVQDQSDKVIHNLLTNAQWMPKEGKKLVDEWLRTIRCSREEFKRTIDKSFDLISNYLERIETESNGKAKGRTKK